MCRRGNPIPELAVILTCPHSNGKKGEKKRKVHRFIASDVYAESKPSKMELGRTRPQSL